MQIKQKKSLWKLLACIIFVVAAGFFYLHMAGEDTGQIEAFQEDIEGTGPGEDIMPAGPGLPEDMIYVHVCGSVKNPGVYCLPPNARVVEAVEAAGGFLPGAASDFLNQAELLSDGQKVYVPSGLEAEELEATGKAAWLPDPPQAEPGSTKIDINTAAVSQLMELEGIGKSKAEAIAAYREEHGRFEKCEDLMKVPGIKEALYQKICDKITTGSQS